MCMRLFKCICKWHGNTIAIFEIHKIITDYKTKQMFTIWGRWQPLLPIVFVLSTILVSTLDSNWATAMIESTSSNIVVCEHVLSYHLSSSVEKHINGKRFCKVLSWLSWLGGGRLSMSIFSETCMKLLSRIWQGFCTILGLVGYHKGCRIYTQYVHTLLDYSSSYV